ncbi:MAG: arginase, partial [Flavobacteriales bacterium]
CHLFNYTSIGMQRPLVAKKNINLFDELYFDICRLGQLNDDFKVAEPLIRNSDLLSIDFKGLKSADTDGSKYPNANGISASQICQIAKYAGMSDKMSCVGIFDIHPEQNNVASGLLAQIIWYFIEGVALRVGDFPIGSKKNYTQFHVHMDDFEEDLVFYKSNKSSRWWLEVRYNSEAGSKYDRHKMVPCDKEDYDNSLNNHVPDLWWKTLKKIN